MMSKIIRFGVSLEDELLVKFDALLERIGYRNRSEAIRDLIRDRLVREAWKEGDKEIVGILSLVYNHEKSEVTERLNLIQHKNIGAIVSTTHIHLDSHNCLEVIILKGKSREIEKISDLLQSTKNVKHGGLLRTTTGEGLE
ncbi:MAG: nickel-responsive transcriptional regulator NikR [Candidatus Aminicenantes bacterium]|nr:nickel-responsive transcriptional regulator NikR [Candidatus Aminicenantes bacterium]HHF51764.1 nickel-responsive transcriptional regulator NikR [Candidatus Aminicenantes bacterium]